MAGPINRTRRTYFLRTQVAVLLVAGLSSAINTVTRYTLWRLWVTVGCLATATILFVGSRTVWATPEEQPSEAQVHEHGLVTLLARVADRVQPLDRDRVRQLTEAGDPGLALETLAVLLAEAQYAVSDDERADMLALAQDLGVGSQVRRTLAKSSQR